MPLLIRRPLAQYSPPAHKVPHPADDGEFPRRGFVEGRVLPGKAGGAQQGGEQMPFPVDIQPLLQLVDHQAVFLVHRQLLQQLRLHIALESLRPDLHPGALLRRGIGLDQRPVPFLPQHMHPLAGAGHHAHIVLAVLLRPGPDPDLIPLVSLQHGHGLGQHLPDQLLVRFPLRHLPEAEIMVAEHLAVLVGRPENQIVSRQRFRRRGRRRSSRNRPSAAAPELLLTLPRFSS